MTAPALDCYAQIDHIADLGLRVTGKTLPDLFRHAGLALFDLLGVTGDVRPLSERRVVVEREGHPLLLQGWLAELLYLQSAEDLLFADFPAVTVRADRVEGVGVGEPFDPARHRLSYEIKAVTYHHLSLTEGPEGWTAQVIFDL